jgi:hypothetical protein
MKNLNFEVGKAYQTRDGRKAVCLTTTLDGKFRIGFQLDGSLIALQMNGKCFADEPESQNDIIGEWIDKPIVDWSLMPAWAKFVAMDSTGYWWWYEKKPFTSENTWRSESEYYDEIPKDYAPKWEGDWEESLIERP